MRIRKYRPLETNHKPHKPAKAEKRKPKAGQNRENRGQSPIPPFVQRRYPGAMKLAVASDHAGVALKALVLRQLLSDGHDASDLGTNTTDPVDYPDYAEAVALAVLGGQAEHSLEDHT